MKHDLVIIGGGASGLMAAITAKDLGADVIILEANDRIGKKILSTGNGRCNITNKYVSSARYHSNNSNFPNDILRQFSVEDTSNFFYSIGLPLVTLEDGKMYPQSLQASSVLDLLRLTLDDKNIPIYLNHKVKSIMSTKNGFKILTSKGDTISANKIILATGGASAPKTGSDGSGFAIAKQLGHNIIKPLPALVQIKLDYNHLKALSGIKFDGNCSIYVDDELKRKEFGEILFTDYGISGPPILQLSRIASYGLDKKKKVHINVNLMSSYEKDELINFLESHFAIFSHRSLMNSLIGVVNKKLIPIILKETNIENIHKPCSELTWQEKNNLITLLQNWEFKVTGTNSFSNCQVTAGGIDTLQIDNSTLQSKIVPNLYFCGELIDVDGDCGGFNLQWAWSSGFVAGKNSCS